MADAELALSLLAARVLALEEESAGSTEGLGAGSADTLSVLAKTLADLKRLRTCLAASSKEVEAQVMEARKVEADNAKLRYQIMHLKRALGSDERGS
jgi:hypothetical protein